MEAAFQGLSYIERNILYYVYPDRTFYARHSMDRYREEEIAKRTIDYNLYFCPGTTLDDWPELDWLRSKGADKHSAFAVPMFVDWKNRGFRLEPRSPSLRLGIKQVDISAAGPTDAFPSGANRG